MALQTWELRWFFDCPPEWFDWNVKETTERTDLYAPLNSDRSSVKLRENQLEVKQLQEVVVVDNWPIQNWAKTSLSRSESNRLLFDSPPDDWLKVTKRRKTQAIGSVGSSAQESDRQTTQVEWTEVRCRSVGQWSFAIEAPASLGSQGVIDAIQEVLGETVLVGLPRTNRSYPQWLSSLLTSH